MALSLAFRLDRHRFAVPIGPVAEVLPFLPVEPVPGAPAFLKGVIFVRGHLIPLVDGAERLNLTRSSPAPADPHILALRHAGRLVGLVVDEALDLVDLERAPGAGPDELMAESGFFDGLAQSGGELYRLVDPERLLAKSEAAHLGASRP